MAYPFLDFITKFRYKDCRWVVERDFHGNFWVNFKWTQSAMEPRWPGQYFSQFEKRLPQPEIKSTRPIHLEIRFNPT